MALANCSRCGRLFNKLHRDICPKCHDEEEELLRQTQDYLRDHRNAQIFELIEELEIEQWMLEKWVNEKRITLVTPESEMGAKKCSECGRKMKPSDAGNICKTCQLKRLMNKKPTEKKTAEPDAELTKDESRGMHFKRKQ